MFNKKIKFIVLLINFLNLFYSGPKVGREHTFSDLMNVFSNPSSPSVDNNLISKLNNMSDKNLNNSANINNNNNSSNNVSDESTGTTTSSTFSNVMSFNSAIDESSNNNNNTKKVRTRPQKELDEIEESEEIETEMEADEAVKYSICSVCNSVSSSSSRSSSVSSFSKSRSASKSGSGGLRLAGPPTPTPASPNVVEEAIANLEFLSKPNRRPSLQQQQQITSPRSHFMREESKQRIERVLATLSAGIIHEVALDANEIGDKEEPRLTVIDEKEIVSDKDKEKEKEIEEPKEEPKITSITEEKRDEQEIPIEQINQIVKAIEEGVEGLVVEGLGEQEIGGGEEEEREKEDLRKRMLDQQHSDNAIQRPQKYHFASEFAASQNFTPSSISSSGYASYQDKDEK